MISEKCCLCKYMICDGEDLPSRGIIIKPTTRRVGENPTKYQNFCFPYIFQQNYYKAT